MSNSKFTQQALQRKEKRTREVLFACECGSQATSESSMIYSLYSSVCDCAAVLSFISDSGADRVISFALAHVNSLECKIF